MLKSEGDTFLSPPGLKNPLEEAGTCRPGQITPWFHPRINSQIAPATKTEKKSFDCCLPPAVFFHKSVKSQ